MDDSIDYKELVKQYMLENENLRAELFHARMHVGLTALEMLLSVWQWIRSNIRYIGIAFDCILIVMSLIYLKKVW